MDQSNVLLVEHLSNINSIIRTPLQSTQRIKFTCFDVSLNYIIFGATSGGLYVYYRYPHAFSKLIPNKHGSVVQVSIAPDERAIALASTRGSVVVIENYQGESTFQSQAYSEHYGNVVTTLQWHTDNNLYCGDNKGKISVISMPNLLSKTIFHTPCASLMQLDSSVIQIDCHSRYLLISTLTRTYLCDTEREQYKQIGKKLRDGEFGACFFVPVQTNLETSSSAHSSPSSPHRGFFTKVTRDDSGPFSPNSVAEGAKIFCSRPGARMWEARFDTSVARTHQFKSFIVQEPSSAIICVDDSPQARFRMSDGNNQSNNNTSDRFCFGRVLVLDGRFILTFNKYGFYVFEPTLLRALCRCDRIGHISDIKVIQNVLYVWSSRDGSEPPEVRIIALYDLERLLLKTLFDKQYYLCGEICSKYLKEVVALSETSNKVHLLAIIKEKLSDTGQLLTKLEPFFEALQHVRDHRFSNRKLSTGIVVVSNSYAAENDEGYRRAMNGDRRQSLPKNLKETSHVLVEATGTNVGTDDGHAMKVFRQQYEWAKLNRNIEMSKFAEILAANSLQDNMMLFNEFEMLMLASEEMDRSELKLWKHEQFLRYFSKLDFCHDDNEIWQFVSESFCSVNSLRHLGCSVCFYPLPSARLGTPDHYTVGCEVLKRFWGVESHRETILKQVPHMWRCAVEELRKNEGTMATLLPVLIQFSDPALVSRFLDAFKYDTWDQGLQLLIKLNRNVCLNCECSFESRETENVMKWTDFGKLMVESIGGPSAVQLLLRYSKFIPPGELDRDFYQTCIFTNSTEDSFRHETMNLSNVLQSDPVTAPQFDRLMTKYLQGEQGLKPKNHFNRTKSDLKCSFCDLPMDLPPLSLGDNAKFKACDHHTYHRICLLYNGDTCKQCKHI